MLPFKNIIVLDKTKKQPLYRQVSLGIIAAITKGVLKPDTFLPSSRALAEILSLHRKTITAAYEELSIQNWIIIQPRKKPRIARNLPLFTETTIGSLNNFSSYKIDFPFLINKTANTITEADRVSEISIDDGYPDVRLSPIDELLKTYRLFASKKYSITNAHVGTIQGTLRLRRALAQYLSETRGLAIAPTNLLITHGAQMSIYLASKLLLKKGAKVIVGKPSYPIASKAFKSLGANMIEVPVDDKGIDTDRIEEVCLQQEICAVYIIPHHHYPTTVTLSAERRMKLIALSKRYKFTIIEDDYDYDYHFTSAPYLPLASGKHHGNIIYIGSFSKILDSSLRLGFMVAPENFITQSVAYRKLIDGGGDGYMQNALAVLIEEGGLKRHLKKTKKVYHQRRDFLDCLLSEKLADFITYTLPLGGMAIWIKLSRAYAVKKLLQHKELHISRVDVAQNAFRFGFASMNKQELQTAVLKLEAILKKTKPLNV